MALWWTRRARVHGDGWDEEPPLAEEIESYCVEVLGPDGATVRSWTPSAPAQTYAAADMTADFGGVTPASLKLRVAQRSAVWGWGVPAQRTLWL